MRKYFLNTQLKLLTLSSQWIITAIILTIVFSIIFYSFLSIITTDILYLSIGFQDDALVPDSDEWFFFKYITAVFSSIISFNFLIKFLLNHPKRIDDQSMIIRTKIRVDQSFYSLNFAYWIIKISFFYGLFLISFGKLLNLYHDYWYLFILMLLVMFLQSWQNIFRYYRSKSYPWFIISLLLILLNALILSQIDFFSHKKMMFLINLKNPAIKYHPQYPYSEIYQDIQKHSLVFRIDVLPFATTDSVNIIINAKEHINLDSIPNYLNRFLNVTSETARPFYKINLAVDKQVKMSFIEKIQNNLAKNKTILIAYSVMSDDQKEHLFGYRLLSFNTYKLIRRPNVFIDEDGHYKIFNKVYDKKQLNIILKQLYLKELNRQPICSVDRGVYIKTEPNTNFNDYFRVIASVFRLVYQLRDDFALENYHKHFKDLDEKQQIMIKYKYPIKVGLSN